ncbi:MAG: DUF2179 domain-containing protein [Candidatus Omnitrophica bacterium]|nr:DUF2179 domain-containing protein [Candidatus Omnitrophota bacterium]
MSTNEMVTYFVVPLLIFFIRIADVSMGTMRIIFISRGIRYLAAILGFFEILIWLFAISQIMQNLNSPLHYIAYAAGFGMGNFVGITIERKLSMGNRVVRIVTGKDAAELVEVLKAKKYGVTSIDGEGVIGPVKLIFSVVKRNHVADLIGVIKEFNPNAFFTVEDIRFVNETHVFSKQSSSRNVFNQFGNFIQKKK